MSQRTAQATDEIGGWVALGDDHDCETCGSSYNHVDWDLDASTVTRVLISSIGCYSADSLDTTDVEQTVAFLTDLAGQFPKAADELADTRRRGCAPP